MKRMKRSSGGALMAILALVIAACTSSPSGSSSGSGNSGQSTGPVTLTVWYYNESGPDVNFMHAIIAAFEKKYPNTTIDLTVYPENNYITKINTAFAVKSAPDVANVYDQMEWLKAGKFLALDSYLQQNNIDVSSFNQGVMSQCTLDSNVYCLGSYAGAVVMFYNRSMFREAGIQDLSATTPLSVSEYVQDAARLTDKAKDVWGTAFGTPVTWLPFTTVVSSDGKTATGVVDSPQTILLYQQLADATRQGSAPTPSTMDAWNQGIDFFAQGKLGMVIGTLGGVNEIEHNHISYGVAPTPVPAGSQPYIATFSNTFGVTSESAHPQQAEEFVAFLGSPEAQLLREKMVGDIPISGDVAQQSGWASAGEAAGRQEALQVVGLAHPSVYIPTVWDVVGPLFDGFNEMVGGQTAQSVLTKAAPQIQSNLDRAWTDWNQIQAPS
jgi:ABC-type glycerol-3-phosphate transport system substrate-binding protein